MKDSQHILAVYQRTSHAVLQPTMPLSTESLHSVAEHVVPDDLLYSTSILGSSSKENHDSYSAFTKCLTVLR